MSVPHEGMSLHNCKAIVDISSGLVHMKEETYSVIRGGDLVLIVLAQ